MGRKGKEGEAMDKRFKERKRNRDGAATRWAIFTQTNSGEVRRGSHGQSTKRMGTKETGTERVRKTNGKEGGGG